ncbi:MAG TPA: L,D-transpeptidase [Actinomycetes bacterium]
MRGLLRNLSLTARRRVTEAAERAATLVRGLRPQVMAAARRAAAPFRRLAPVRQRAAAVAGSLATLPARLPAPLRRGSGLLGKLARPLRAAGGPLRAWQRTALAGVLAVLLLLGGAMVAGAWASGPSDRILAGVTVAGLDVGGMTRDEAVRAVNAHLKPSLNRPIMVRIGSKSFRMTPAGVGRGRSVDQAVDQALTGPRLSLFGSFWHRVVKRPVTMDVEAAGTRQDQRVAKFVGRIAAAVAVAPVDAAFELRDGEVLKQHARSGRALDQDAATKALIKVLGQPNRSEVKLRLQAVAPKVTDAALGRSIEIDKSVNHLWLYDGLRVVKSYRVATAKVGFVTPSGTWKVAYKEVNPTWHNPDPTGWGAGEPLVIPPGPGNPLGTRAMALNAPGILIHGSYATGSIGSYASHGCIRMAIWDAEDIFPRVPVGTRVLIHS